MDPLSVSASIIAIVQVTGKLIEILRSSNDASKEQKRCAAEIANIQYCLLALDHRIEDSEPNTPWFKEAQALSEPDGPLDQCEVALEELQAKITTGSRIRKLGLILAWKFIQEDINSILARIQRITSLIHLALQHDHFKLSEAIKQGIASVQQDTTAIKDDTSSLRQREEEKRRLSIANWLSTSDYHAQKSDILSQRHRNTGKALLESSEFSNWVSKSKDSTKTLFCPGMPGSGKTMTSAVVIEHLLEVKEPASAVVFVFFNFKRQASQTLEATLLSILRQLVLSAKSVPEAIEKFYEKYESQQIPVPANQATDTLQESLVAFPTIFFVIDALDECSVQDGVRSRFLKELLELQNQGYTDLRLMFTSRFVPEIEVFFEQCPRFEVRATSEDVRSYVAAQSYRLSNSVRNDDSIRDLVVNTIVQAVDGMFLLARLYVESLQDVDTRKAVKQLLSKFSEQSGSSKPLQQIYDRAYEEALLRIECQTPSRLKRSKQVISWISLAKRPLTSMELLHALAVEPRSSALDPDDIPAVEDALSVCAGLVVIDKESDVVRLVHYTTQDFFERRHADWNPLGTDQIALVCLTYLSFNDWSIRALDARKTEYNSFCDVMKEHDSQMQGKSLLPLDKQEKSASLYSEYFHWLRLNVRKRDPLFPSVSSQARGTGSEATIELEDIRLRDDVKERILKDFPLLEYTSTFWMDHTRPVQQVNDVSFAALSFLGNKPSISGFHLFSKLREPSNRMRNQKKFAGESTAKFELYQQSSALHCAAHFGLVSLAGELLRNSKSTLGISLDYRNSRGSTAIMSAVSNGQIEVLDMLLKAGATTYGALHKAVEFQDILIIKLLIAHGADLNATFKFESFDSPAYGTPLYMACEWADFPMARLLIELGARFHTDDMGLTSCVHNGSREILELLLDFDVNPGPLDLSRSWLEACFPGNLVLAKLVLKFCKRDKFAACQPEWMLVRACERNSYEVVRYLLEENFDPNSRAFRMEYKMRFNTVNYHLDEVVDTDDLVTALQAACLDACSVKLVELLLDNGADVRLNASPFLTALHAAAWHKDCPATVVSLLIDAGSDLEAAGDLPLATLFIPSTVDSTNLIISPQAYIEKWVNSGPYGVQSHTYTPLWMACLSGNLPAVKRLLQKGANASIYGLVRTLGSSPPDPALWHRAQQILASFSSQSQRFASSAGPVPISGLAIAALGNFGVIARLLLEHGACVDGLALLFAIHSGNEAIVKLVLNSTDDFDLQDYGGTFVWQAHLTGNDAAAISFLRHRNGQQNSEYKYTSVVDGMDLMGLDANGDNLTGFRAAYRFDDRRVMEQKCSETRRITLVERPAAVWAEGLVQRSWITRRHSLF